MTSVSSRRQENFATTRWSLVMRMDASSGEHPRDVMAELCLRYWYPIYAYVRRCGHAPAIAQDITRSFLQNLIRHFRDASRAKPREHFRRYLLARLDGFLAGDWRDTSDEPVQEITPPTEDLEARNARDNIGVGSPEQAFQRSFALEIISRAFKRLRAEAAQTGHAPMYDALEPYLAKEPGPGVYEDIAKRVESRPLALVVALKRLRQRFRELIGAELTDTVTSAEDLEEEQQALHAVLRELG